MAFSVARRMAEAADLLRSGKRDEAVAAFEQVIRHDPSHLQALYHIGSIAYQMGKDQRAIELLSRAKAVDANQPQILNVLSLSQRRQGEFVPAIDNLKRAIALAPQSAPLHNNLGSIQEEVDDVAAAAESYKRAVNIDPSYATAHFNLGGLQQTANELADAANSLQTAVELQPEYVPAWTRLSRVLCEDGRQELAAELLGKASQKLPQSRAILCELADALHLSGQSAAAKPLYQRLVNEPEYSARSHYGLGCLYIEAKEYAEAIECLRQCADAGGVAQEGKLQQNLGRALLEMGYVDDALDCYRQAMPRLNDAERNVAWTSIVACLPFCRDVTQPQVLDIRQEWDQAQTTTPLEGQRDASLSSGRMRIGYVSSFYRRRNWMKPVWGLLENHDRAKFEVHVFSDGAEEDIEEGYPVAHDRFHNISAMTNRDVAQLIQQSGIDVLVDLNGFSRLERLGIFRLRPAQKIVGWFNMFATTGMACFDYLIGDPTVVPENEESYYCESILRVPNTYLAFQVTYPTPDVVNAPSLTAPFTFGALAPQYKITPAVVSTWSQILRRAPESQLLLRNTALGSGKNRHHVLQRFAQHGVAEDRLLLHGPAEHYEFLESYSQIDVALDTFPYNGGTTTTEALWQGVPVVTQYGDRWVARTSASLLNSAGLGRFIAANTADYVDKAVRLSERAAQSELSTLRREMRAHLLQSAACDVKKLAMEIETLYEAM